MAAIATMVAQTVQQVMAAQPQVQPQQPQAQPMPDHQPRRTTVDEKHYRKLVVFGGEHWKDWSFQFRSSTRASSGEAYDILNWAEKETAEISDFSEMDNLIDEDVAERLSGELFNVISTTVKGEPLQLLHNCDFNGAEAWRRLSKRYSPSTPLRAMQLMIQVVNPGKSKNLKDIQSHIDRWEARVLALERDFKETVGSKMKAAILISMLPADLQNALIQQADKYEEYGPTKEKIISIVEAKIAMKSPDDMDVDWLAKENEAWYGNQENDEDIDWLGKGGGIQCHRCGGLGHISKNCGSPEPAKGKSKGQGKNGKGDGKGGKNGKFGYKGGNGKNDYKGKGNGKNEYCSYCGKPGHGPKECWSKQKDDAAAGLAAVDPADEEDQELSGFDMAGLDIIEPPPVPTWTEVVSGKNRKAANLCKLLDCCPVEIDQNGFPPLPRIQPDERTNQEKRIHMRSMRKPLDCCPVEIAGKRQKKPIGAGKITIDSGAAESVMPMEMLKEIQLKESKGSKAGVQYIAANGGRMPNLGEKQVHFKTSDGAESNVVFQVTHARKPLASVSKMVKKGNRVIFSPSGSYIENIATKKRIDMQEVNGTYQIDVEYLAEDFPRRA